MQRSQKPGMPAGLFLAAMVTAALIGIFYFGWRVAGLPFVPFDLFDWLTRMLPGRVIAFGIGVMVSIIRAAHAASTSQTAKLAEQLMAVAGCFVAGSIGGAILFALIRSSGGRRGVSLGLALGVLFGVAAMLISLRGSQTAAVPAGVSAAWVLGAFLTWGAVLGRAEQRLINLTDGTGVPSVETSSTIKPSVERIDRRRFLIWLGGSTALITVTGAVLGELAEIRRRQMMPKGIRDLWSSTHSLPNANAAVKPANGTRPEFTPLERHYRIDINTIPPSVDERQWRLKIQGLVETPLALGLEELKRYQPLHQFITLSCISNPVGGDLIGTTRWTGVSLQRLLPDLKVKPAATHLKIHAADGFYEVVSLEAIKNDEGVMLAYAWDGVPLPREHGFPLRIYIPDVYGMKQPKWIDSIEATDDWEPGYWVVRGWSKVAQMKATSVIDTVAVDMDIVRADERKLVPIGGIAHAGARGISRVEVRTDDGPWEPAALRTPLSSLTWVIWRYDWAFQPGTHTFAVRCWDGNGTAQITTPSPAEPDGATGIDNRTMMF
jgi:DMSO/TMAO reductase YedYZ molybdopterin-dependent catalytic subunit